MLEGPLVFVDVDTQRDFLEPTGALYVPGSWAILANLARLTAFAKRHGVPVLATACAHEEDDAELALFPPHCLAGTAGQRRVEATAWPGGVVLGPEARHSGDLPPHLTIEKREQILRALEDYPYGLAELRGVLTPELEWRLREGLV